MISYFDAHCDTISRCWETGESLRKNGGHIDLQRAKCFARYAQFFALYTDAAETPDPWRRCNELHDVFLQEMSQNAACVAQCRTGTEVDAATAAGKCAAILSIEGADLLDCQIDRIKTAADWGIRFLNPVWNRANILSGTNIEDSSRGLSPYGREFIREMETNGIYADVSHISDSGFWDILRMTRRPVVASHSNSRTLCAHPRNLTDDMFRAIRETGGVVGINLYRNFVGDDQMETLLRHIEHFLDLGGEKTVCIGADLDGCDTLAGGLCGVQDISEIYRALCARGYDKTLLDDIFWNNLRRLL